MNPHDILQTTAFDYDAAGLAVIPVNSAKRPTVKTWAHYQQTKPCKDDIRNWFMSPKPETTGIAIIAGKVSCNIEVFDIDCKYDLSGSLMEDFCALVKEHLPELFPKLVIAKTVNEGFHIPVRVPVESLEGNQKVASRPATPEEAAKGDKVKALIETKGEGGYFIAEPTVGYGWIQGTAKDIPSITTEEREMLFTIARSFDQMTVKDAPEERSERTDQTKTGVLSPFEDYNERADTPKLLEKHGWQFVYQRGESLHYKRPGTTDSATSANFHTGLRVFYVFSTSTEFEAGRGYNPVHVYTELEHGGDYSAASKALYAAGYGSRWNSQKTEQTETQATEQATKEWLTDPKPLDLTLKPVEAIDDDCLPKVLVNWLRPSSKVIGCPFDFLVLSAVIMVGSIIGSRLRVKPLQNSDWFVAPNLYGGLVGLPPTKKTPALDETRKTILELQCAARREFENAKKDYEIDAKFYEKQSVKTLKESITSDDYKRNMTALDETKPKQPTLRRFETNDITASKLIQFLAENPNGLMLFRDELTGWLKSLEAEYDKSARAFFLELWKGAISYELARVDGREIQLSSGTLSIVGGVQPSKLQRYVSEAYSFDNSDGFLQRFIFAYPDPQKSGEKSTKSDYEQMQSGYAAVNKLVKELAGYDFHGKELIEVTGANGDVFHALKFDREAQAAVDQWKDEIETEAEKLQIEDEAFSSFLYKLPKNCFAIALIFHCLENIDKLPFPDEITLETAFKAITYTDVLISHARRVFAHGENQIFALAQTLIGKLKKGELRQGFTQREVARKQWSGLKTPDTLREVLTLLVDYGYLKASEIHGDGRPTVRYYIHPALESEVVETDEN